MSASPAPSRPAWLASDGAGPEAEPMQKHRGARADAGKDPDLSRTPRTEELPGGVIHAEMLGEAEASAALNPTDPWHRLTPTERGTRATAAAVTARVALAQARRAGYPSVEAYLAATADPPELAALAAKRRRPSSREPSRSGAGAAARPGQPISAQALMAEHFTEPRWAVPGIVPEGLTVFASKPKLGKSWLTMGLAVAIAGGGRALGLLEVEQGPVLVLALEDTARRVQSRLVTILDDGAEAPDGLEVATGWRRIDDGGLDDLRAWLVAHPTARLIVVDTLKRVRPDRNNRDARLYDDDYNELVGLKALADEFGVAIVVVHHLRKAKADDPIDALNASSGMAGAADAILVLERGRGEHDAKLHVQGRDVEEAAHVLRWSPGAGTWTIVDPVLADLTAERAELLEYLAEAGGRRTPTVAAIALGRPYGSVKRLMWSMARDGQLLGGGREGYYLPGSDGSLGSLGSDGDPGSLGDAGSGSRAAAPARAPAREENPPNPANRDSQGSVGSGDSSRAPARDAREDPLADDVDEADLADPDDVAAEIRELFPEPPAALV